MRVVFSRLIRWVRRDQAPPEIRRACELVDAIDAGGIPLDPSVIRRVAEDLGLEVSRRASTEETVERIRAAIQRHYS